ncbi:MAG: 3-isopropylmalate dehydrogenase [Thermoanaerobacteraceae bacterium]|uniref:3-isopropylmalate dehydrogenase n=1 Tax=Thermanaeromonas sp. C210 TaxID=2731925 RepID=UPI00155C4437|nr:3-isopropylmalate dehydrogenase [Thermanaeromonas sp. C210]MBE3581415.1 3-isopropylmalate dehydrogenase [Thermoanaerobacteraceae bacterium]GFN22007.1 3-isopropylmalate dehydrogenase [Thermanaeromonas sp. C210]
MFKIAVLPGDGIGPEIVPEAVKVLKAVGKKYGVDFDFREGLVGGAAIDATGTALPAETLQLCRESDAVLLGAVGGPRWDNLPPAERPETAALLALRKGLGLYANLRPAYLFPALAEASPLRREIVEGTDLLVVRELTGGLYFGEKKRERTPSGEVAWDTLIYNTEEIERILRLGFELARQRRKKLTSVDKANVLITSRLWRETAERLAREYPDVELTHMYVDNCAMQLVRWPRQFDVLVMENTFGDILSDLSSVLTGSIGMLASASIGGKVALYEPAHGSAPDIAGQKKANPLATILSAALMLRVSFKLEEAAREVEAAVGRVLDKGFRTADIMSEGKTLVNTEEMGTLVRQEVEEG